MQVKQADPSRLVITIENVTAVRRFLIPFFEPGDLQSVHYLERNGSGLWSYYGLAWAASTARRCYRCRMRHTSTARSRFTATLLAVPIARTQYIETVN